MELNIKKKSLTFLNFNKNKILKSELTNKK